jgi:hypothetical protein
MMDRLGLRQRRRNGRAGQALVEFALVFPIFFLMLMGLVDVGRFVYTDSTLSQAAREGARVGAVEAGWIGVPGSGCVSALSGIGASNPGAHVCPATVASMKSDIVSAVNRMVVSLGQITINNVYLSCNTGQSDDMPPSGAWTETAGATSPQGNGCEDSYFNATGVQGDILSVRVVYTYQPITPIVSTIVPSVQRSASASMVIN